MWTKSLLDSGLALLEAMVSLKKRHEADSSHPNVCRRRMPAPWERLDSPILREVRVPHLWREPEFICANVLIPAGRTFASDVFPIG